MVLTYLHLSSDPVSNVACVCNNGIWQSRKSDASCQEKVEESAKKTKKKKKIIKTEINLPKCEGGDPTKWKNCLGIFLYDNGHEYEGEYQNGKIVKGTAIYPGGSKYVGNFKNEKHEIENTQK